MPYSKLLRKIVIESGYNSTEIIKKCEEKGKKIDKAYFSKLLNNKVPAPSEDLSRIIANICNFDERKLVLEGYFDKAPKEITECINNIKRLLTLSSLKIFDNKLNNEELNLIQDIMEQEPLSEFIISILDCDVNKENNIIKLSNKNEIEISVTEPTGIKIYDNSMFPLITENSQITLKIEKEYKNGDIVLLKTKDIKIPIARYILYDKDNIIITSLNKEFETLTYKIKDVEILGKVNKVINSI